LLWVFGVFFWFLFNCVWYCIGTVQPLFCLRVVSVGFGGWGWGEGVFLVLGWCFGYAFVPLLV
jgi:hypothetical protein